MTVCLTCVRWTGPRPSCVSPLKPMSMIARTMESTSLPGGAKHSAVSQQTRGGWRNGEIDEGGDRVMQECVDGCINDHS